MLDTTNWQKVKDFLFNEYEQSLKGTATLNVYEDMPYFYAQLHKQEFILSILKYMRELESKPVMRG